MDTPLPVAIAPPTIPSTVSMCWKIVVSTTVGLYAMVSSWFSSKLLPTPIGIMNTPCSRRSGEIAVKLPLRISLTKTSKMSLALSLPEENNVSLTVLRAAVMLSAGWFRGEILSIAVDTADKL